MLKDSYDFSTPFKRWQYTVGWELLFQYLGPVYHVARGFVVARPWAIQHVRRSLYLLRVVLLPGWRRRSA
ncbi:MAG: hypothetical protein U0514_00805 [Candidatus Andersenbacteria bacterium]